MVRLWCNYVVVDYDKVILYEKISVLMLDIVNDVRKEIMSLLMYMVGCLCCYVIMVLKCNIM